MSIFLFELIVGCFVLGLDDFVCVIGMVNVKVLGLVKNGEWIFVLLEYLGVVIF